MTIFSSNLNLTLPPLIAGYTSIYILADENTHQFCYPLLTDTLNSDKNTLIIPAGEENKNLENCSAIWKFLSDTNADRHSVLINLGGGMISDIGGFAANTYKRGIDFIHIPTTLLGMADAAIGGKTGINFQTFKNQIGTFTQAKATIIHPQFLKTLPKRQMLSGFAEVLKYALIKDKELWKKTDSFPANEEDLTDIIKRCISIKTTITKNDPFEKGERKLLNFGHTIGHALESLAMTKNEDLLHGEAIAAGIIMEAYLSHLKSELKEEELNNITARINKLYQPLNISSNDFPELLKIMLQDKKNNNNTFLFSLLNRVGKGIYDIPCTESEIIQAMNYYISKLPSCF